MVVAETLAGIALAKAAVSGVKSMIDTAKGVNDIAHHLDDLFKGHEQIHSKQVKKGNKEWNTYLVGKFKDESEDVGVSLSDVTAEVIEQKQIEEQMKAMKNMLNKRFGFDTWDEILELRKKRIEEVAERKKRQINKVRESQEKSKKFWGKLLLETGKIVGIVVFVLSIYWYIATHSVSKLPWFW